MSKGYFPIRKNVLPWHDKLAGGGRMLWLKIAGALAFALIICLLYESFARMSPISIGG